MRDVFDRKCAGSSGNFESVLFFLLICKLWSFSLSCMVSTAVGCPEKKVSVTLKMNKKIISPGVHWYLWFFLMRSIRSDALVTFNCKTNSLPNPFYCNGIQMNFARLHELVQWWNIRVDLFAGNAQKVLNIKYKTWEICTINKKGQWWFL